MMLLKMMGVMDCNMKIPEVPRYQFAREKAIDILIDYGTNSIPISVKKIANNLPMKIKFNTYSNLLNKGFSLSDIYNAYNSEEGAVLQSDDSYCIVYNDVNRNSQRIRFTIAHEIGHIVLGHLEFNDCLCRLGENEYEVLEKEANQFASQLLSPEPIIHDILQKSHKISSIQIQSIFDISFQSANCVVDRLNSRGGIYCYKEEELHSLYADPLQEIYELFT